MLPWPPISPNWRIILSPLLAVLVSYGLFYLMHQLLQHKSSANLAPIAPIMVNIERVNAPVETLDKTIKPPPSEPPAATPIGQTSAPPAAPIAAPTLSATGIAIDAIAIDEKALAVEQKNWSAPIAGQGSGGKMPDYIGQADTGGKAFTPISTRRPNIPKVAFDNRINGWVLLSFEVSPKGQVQHIQVMDAEPRGVFEANAIAAVKTWIYPSFKGPAKRLSQRIEFQWSMYSYNMDY